MWHTPLASLDKLLLGAPVPFIQEASVAAPNPSPGPRFNPNSNPEPKPHGKALDDPAPTGSFWSEADVLCDFAPGRHGTPS